MTHHPDPTSADAVVEAVHAGLQMDHVYVDPALASDVTAAQLKAIEHDAATAPYPVFVVLYPFSEHDAFSGDPLDLLTRLHQAHPVPGLYVSSGLATTTEYGSIDVAAQPFGVPALAGTDIGDELPITVEHASTLGAAFEQALGLVRQGPDAVERASDRTLQAYESSQPHSSSDSSGSSGDGSGGLSGGAITAIVLTVVVLLVTAALVVGRRRDRRVAAGGRGASTPPFTLPASAMDRIREAHDRRLEEQARSEVLALGERIDHHELPTHATVAVTTSWQAALDRYDAAGAVLDRHRPVDVLDVVGALVLTRQGDAALTAALAGRAWTPEPTCYLDPLHGRSSVTRVVDPGNGAAREVPLCAQCRRDVDAHRSPGILDVERRGEPVHYFDSGVEPWASTGYGCFGDDLITAVRRAS